MTNLSTLSKAIIFAAIAGIAAICTAGLAFIGASPLVISAAAAVQLVAVGLVIWQIRSTKGFLAEVVRVCSAIRVGDFDQRLVLPKVKGDVKVAADRINAMVDINDAFVREAALAMLAVGEGRFYRKIRPEGMKGMFLNSVENINVAIETMGERQEMIGASIAEVSRLVRHATDGDLSQRIDTSRFTGQYLDFTNEMNALLDTISAPITETGDILSSLADMDLTQRMHGDYKGSFAKLRDDTNAVGDKLSDIVGQLRETSQGVKTATGEILEGANDLSERTTKQAATIEETSAAMEQLASTVMEKRQEGGGCFW